MRKTYELWVNYNAKILIILLLVFDLCSSDKVDYTGSLHKPYKPCLFHKFNVKKAQKVTYEVRVVTKIGVAGSGTAVAISSNGKLVTAYHNIDSYKSVVVIDSDGNKYNVRIGRISIENDLAYII